ncbi:MAG TPA: flagellar hook assembly protein FlgD [Methylococcaceae bacterium]|jgi:flagellar basal-body rod modification protein FlgD|nr:flagellar hook assembly protein FlgD [Methylococcaceae bacterium]
MSTDINVLQSLGLTQKPAAPVNQNALGENMFMKLMVAQLQNQNPLNPQDGAQFLSQLAQFSTVTGIQGLQQSFADFASSMTQDQALQAANLVGKNVLVSSGQGILSASGGLNGQITVPSGATNVTVRVVGSNGVTLRTFDMGTQEAGQVPFSWDGMLDDGVSHANPGIYKIQAEAILDGKTIALDSQVSTPVDSVTLGGAQGIEVDLGVLGKHALKDIQEIL